MYFNKNIIEELSVIGKSRIYYVPPTPDFMLNLSSDSRVRLFTSYNRIWTLEYFSASDVKEKIFNPTLSWRSFCYFRLHIISKLIDFDLRIISTFTLSKTDGGFRQSESLPDLRFYMLSFNSVVRNSQEVKLFNYKKSSPGVATLHSSIIS